MVSRMDPFASVVPSSNGQQGQDGSTALNLSGVAFPGTHRLTSPSVADGDGGSGSQAPSPEGLPVCDGG